MAVMLLAVAMAPPPERRPHPLDRPLARVAALGVFAAMLALLAVIHRDDLFGAPTAATVPASPADLPSPAEAGFAKAGQAYAACLAARHGQIDGMAADGVVTADQAALFKTRAEALCRDLANKR